MNRNPLLLFLALVFSLGVSAQSGFSSSVIASAGSSSQKGKTRLEWTLGETAVATIITTSGLLTEGFHQPEILKITPVSGVRPVTSDTELVTIAPNPVSTWFTIYLPRDWSAQTSMIALFDAWGKQVQTGQIQPGQANAEWDMSMHPTGTYWLRIVAKDSQQVQTFKVIKIY
ncbi:MAG: T9SS type A sorting domain-containing protein [Saprospiraceae bacterium]|nr:T9SS type A sorting domain-containing protein [Saprospiraceae bacterium]